jgi:hypothetical protein
MADLNALIAQGYQFQAPPDPFAQYGKMQQLENSATQNRLAQQQMTENAQLAPLRMREAQAKLNTADLTYEQLKGAQDFVAGVMAKTKENGSNVNDPMDAAKQMLMHPNPTVQGMGKHLAEAYQLIQGIEQQQRFAQGESSPNSFGVPARPAPGATPMPSQASAPVPLAPAAPGEAGAPVLTGNALAPVAPPVNALAAQPITAEKLAADIDKGDRLYGSAPGWKNQRERMMKQYDQLLKPPTLHVVEGNLVGPDGKPIYEGENIPKKRLEFDKQKFEWEKANPGYEVKEVPQANGTIKLVGVNKRTNEAVPITMSGKELVSPNIAAQRLSFDQNKFNWEKANPGYSVKEVPQADGTIQFVGVNNRTLQAMPITLGNAPAVAPAAGGGRGSVGVTDNQGAAGTPLVGASSKGLTETQGNATAFGMRMKDSSTALKNLENKGATNTGVIGGTVGGVVGLVPLIGDKLTAGVDNIYNVLPQVMGGYSPEQQQILNGRINFVTALLRKESGAAISPTEFATAEKLYFPRPGDDATVIKQKQNARDLAIKAMKVQAGPGAKAIDEIGAGGTSSASDPLGIR